MPAYPGSLHHTARAALLLCCPLLISCASTFEMKSSPASVPCVADGDDAEWSGKLAFLEDPPILIGVENDGQNVYVCLKANDPQMIRGLLMSGVTLWFDRNGGTDHTFGIRLPFHMERADRNRDGTGERPLPTATLDEIELLGEQESDHTLVEKTAAATDFGVMAGVKTSPGSCVCEIVVPRSPRAGHYGIGPVHNGALGLVVETGKMKSAGRFAGREGGGEREGRMGRRGGGRPEGPEGPPQERRREMAKTLTDEVSITLKVNLAAGDR